MFSDLEGTNTQFYEWETEDGLSMVASEARDLSFLEFIPPNGPQIPSTLPATLRNFGRFLHDMSNSQICQPKALILSATDSISSLTLCCLRLDSTLLWVHNVRETRPTQDMPILGSHVELGHRATDVRQPFRSLLFSSIVLPIVLPSFTCSSQRSQCTREETGKCKFYSTQATDKIRPAYALAQHNRYNGDDSASRSKKEANFLIGKQQEATCRYAPYPRGTSCTLHQLDAPSNTTLRPAIHTTRLPDTNPTGESPLELHPSGDKLTQIISPRGTHTTTTHSHHASSGSATMDYAHSIHAHTQQGNKSPASRPATTDISGPFAPHTDSPREDSAFLGTNLKRGSLPWSNSGSSSEFALLILVAFTKRTPSYADTPSCSSGNLVKVHLANRLQPPERTKATPLAVHRILVDVQAVCGVSHLADPSPRSLAQHKGESIGVEKKQRL
ncbi:hypothetical protein DFH09DRAFT_1093509 [Mycena vulgaris]|nr:hypothetical protein DFH09DRAFT_1093509 [Mycena vulgaris]